MNMTWSASAELTSWSLSSIMARREHRWKSKPVARRDFRRWSASRGQRLRSRRSFRIASASIGNGWTRATGQKQKSGSSIYLIRSNTLKTAKSSNTSSAGCVSASAYASSSVTCPDPEFEPHAYAAFLYVPRTFAVHSILVKN